MSQGHADVCLTCGGVEHTGPCKKIESGEGVTQRILNSIGSPNATDSVLGQLARIEKMMSKIESRTFLTDRYERALSTIAEMRDDLEFYKVKCSELERLLERKHPDDEL